MKRAADSIEGAVQIFTCSKESARYHVVKFSDFLGKAMEWYRDTAHCQPPTDIEIPWEEILEMMC